MTHSDYDLVVLGGGLAGGLLCRQLALQRPELRVLCIERSTTTSYKVGEATVELFSNYLVRRLGMSTELYEHHLPKNGLRFFFDQAGGGAPLQHMSEIGSLGLPLHPSFQIDRSRFERDLRQGNRDRGVELIEGGKVLDVELGDPHHRVTFANAGREQQVATRWVVDATGRTSLLKKQLGLHLAEPHHRCLGAWARLSGVVDLDGATMDQAFRDRTRNTSRRLSTVHFMHRGYWIWMIPLKGGVTSIGLVGDQRHTSREVLCQDGLREFLERQAAVRELIGDAEWLDFGGYGQLAYGTRRWFGDRWAVIGEAAAFSDPFYSPGSDFIAIANDYCCDLIARQLDGEDIAERQRLYDGYLQFRYRANLPLYRDQYELFGSRELMSIKWNFDIAAYYALWVDSYLQDRHLDPATLRHELRQAPLVIRVLEHFGRLFTATGRRLSTEDRYHRQNLGHFDEALGDVPFLREVGSLDPKRAAQHTLDAFHRARARCFALLGQPVANDEPLGFADYVDGSALAATEHS